MRADRELAQYGLGLDSDLDVAALSEQLYGAVCERPGEPMVVLAQPRNASPHRAALPQRAEKLVGTSDLLLSPSMPAHGAIYGSWRIAGRPRAQRSQ